MMFWSSGLLSVIAFFSFSSSFFSTHKILLFQTSILPYLSFHLVGPPKIFFPKTNPVAAAAIPPTLLVNR